MYHRFGASKPSESITTSLLFSVDTMKLRKYRTAQPPSSLTAISHLYLQAIATITNPSPDGKYSTYSFTDYLPILPNTRLLSSGNKTLSSLAISNSNLSASLDLYPVKSGSSCKQVRKNSTS